MVNAAVILQADDIYLRSITLNDVNSVYLSWLQDEEAMQGIATSGYTLEKLKNKHQSKHKDEKN